MDLLFANSVIIEIFCVNEKVVKQINNVHIYTIFYLLFL